MGHIHTFWRSRSNKTRMKESSDWRIALNRLDPFIKRKFEEIDLIQWECSGTLEISVKDLGN